MKRTVEVGQYWLFDSGHEDEDSIWKVVPLTKDVLNSSTRLPTDICLEAIHATPVESTNVVIGGVYSYRADTLLGWLTWSLIDEDDVPLYILGKI